jgi:quercetin dioxygenase-like cupin family protein
VAIFIPKDYVHWFRNLEPDKEVEIVGCYNKADAGDYKSEDYVYIGEIKEQTENLMP